MRNMQAYLKEYQKEMKWDIAPKGFSEEKASLLHNYMLLTTEVSEIANEFRSIFNQTLSQQADGQDLEEAFAKAKADHKSAIGNEIADCFAYLVKFANYFEIDLEESFYAKMDEVKHRKNRDIVE